MINKPMSLSSALGLRPLDRVQLADRRRLAELSLDRRKSGDGAVLPFLFFQRVKADGMLELRSPGGSVVDADPLEVCDVMAGEPITLLAMPRCVHARLALLSKQRAEVAGLDSYRPAMVRYVIKDRWHRVDRVFVTFEDDALNIGAHGFAAPVNRDDVARLARLATRANMPVMGRGSANASADKGVERAQSVNRAAAAAVLQRALARDDAAVRELTALGAAPLKLAQINGLRRRAR
jgi:hypothetical protein